VAHDTRHRLPRLSTQCIVAALRSCMPSDHRRGGGERPSSEGLVWAAIELLITGSGPARYSPAKDLTGELEGEVHARRRASSAPSRSGDACRRMSCSSARSCSGATSRLKTRRGSGSCLELGRSSSPPSRRYARGLSAVDRVPCSVARRARHCTHRQHHTHAPSTNPPARFHTSK